jgi:hypothetical protein
MSYQFLGGAGDFELVCEPASPRRRAARHKTGFSAKRVARPAAVADAFESVSERSRGDVGEEVAA